VPAYIESSANIQKAVADILASKCFDNGTVCSSEQAIITDLGIKEQVVTELKEQGAYFLNAEETQKVQVYAINPRGGMNPEIVGQPAQFIARQAGINVPARTRVLVAELEGVGKQYPLSGEKLSPILAFYIASDWVKACERCIELLTYMGLGHTLVIHSGNEEVIREFALKKPAFRILVNTPGTHGAIGFSTGLEPALTLGCGTWGGSITSDNVTPLHLINIKRLAYEIHPVRDIARVLNGRGAAEIVAEQVKKEEAPRILSDEEVEKVVADFMQWRKGKGRGGV
jgi:acetaldehyde dehydrogenase (acetylating)